MEFRCPKCKYDIMWLRNDKEVMVKTFNDASYLQNIYSYGEKDKWLGTCDLCGYGFEAKTLTELIENLETVGAVK